MKTIIREMFFDSIEGNELNGNTEYEMRRKICDEAYNKLAGTLTESQQKLFDLYYDAEGDVDCEWEAFVFEKGFKLGMLLCMEVLR